MTDRNSAKRELIVVAVIAVVFLLCTYDLYEVARTTGNDRGMWFSVVHMALVGVGSWFALRRSAH